MQRNNLKTREHAVLPDRPSLGAARRIAMTVREATSASGLGKTTIYALMKAGELPSMKIGSRRLIRQDDLDRILQSDRANDE